MISFIQAKNIFKKRFSNLVILRCVDYSDTHYIFEAVENPHVIDHNSPYYTLDKKTGEVSVFIPTLDLDAFFDAVENRTIYSTY